MQLPFCGGSYLGRSKAIQTSRSVNFYTEISDATSKTPNFALIGTPGTKEFVDFGSDAMRLVYNFAGRCFVVAADSLYEVYSDGSKSTVIDTLNDSSGAIYAADNGLTASGVGGNQMIMITNNTGYIYDIGAGTVTLITDGNFPTTPKYVCFADGYFIVVDDSMVYRTSALYDGMTYPALAFATATSSNDKIKRPIYTSQQLFLIKENVTELWFNNQLPTTVGSPFSRSTSIIDMGTVAPNSVVKGGSAIFMLANQKNSDYGEFVGVVAISGNSPTIISTPSITYFIKQMATISDAIGYFYTDEGHSFYVLTFPTSDVTLVYDVSTQLWHERSTYVPDEEYSIKRHIGSSYTNFSGKHLLTSYLSSKLLEMSSEYFDDDGQPIVSEKISQIVFDNNELDNIPIHKLQVDIESGVGNSNVTSPKAHLSWSDDSGNTWSNEYECGMGEIGKYQQRLIWRRLGIARNKVFKLKMSDAVKKVVLGSYVS